ncbi:hypothetical protein ON010_g5570 [Phytophthora cinnamomi]|nr:hypothetical protein ON010_g5570 [Phytophthora cinnamomi]
MREQLRMDMSETDARKAKEDEVLLHDLVLEKTLDQERAHQSQKRTKRDRSDGIAERPTQRGPVKQPIKKPRLTSEPRSASPRPPTKTAADRPKVPPTPCPHCSDMQWLSECLKASDDQKAEIRRKLRAQRASDGNKRTVARLKRLRECLPSEEKSLLLNGVLSVPFCADTGADRTAVGRQHVEQLQQLDPSVTVRSLETLVVNVTVGDHEVTCMTSVHLCLLLNTAAWPVSLHEPVECLIIDDDDPEFILGQHVLKSLGIDIDRQLEQLAVRGEDKDDEELEVEDDLPSLPSSGADNDLRGAFEQLVAMALNHGFPRRLELGNDPPAKVDPLKIRLKGGASAVKSKPRQYRPAVRAFLREFNDRLVELGWVYENPSSRWASPALPVRKPGENSDEYRHTCDYRVVNDLIEALTSTMPHMATLLEHTRGKKHFGLFDLLKGFWQLPLDELSQELMSYITDTKIYTPRRVPQGCCDAAVHFQQTMERCFDSLLYGCIVIWIDDLLLFSDDIDTYVTKLEEFFDLVAMYGLKLSAKKSSIYQQSVKWCGRIINSDGVSHDPSRIDALRSMPYPTTVGHLQQFLCAANWVREYIVDYGHAVEPLQQRLDTALKRGKRSKSVAAGISVTLTDAERVTFDKVKDLLATPVTLALPDDSATTIVCSDASNNGWSVIVTQVSDYDAKIPVTAQQHKLLTCLSGTFKGSQLNWTVIEKEA